MIPVYYFKSLEDIIKDKTLITVGFLKEEKDKTIYCGTTDKKYKIDIENIKEDKYIIVKTYVSGFTSTAYFGKVKIKYEIKEKDIIFDKEPEIELDLNNIFGLKKILIIYENNFIYLDPGPKLLIRKTDFFNENKNYLEIDLAFAGFKKDNKIIYVEDEEEYLERSSYFRRY